MAIKRERKRDKAGTDLETFEAHASRAYSMLDSAKIGLNGLKTKMGNSPAVFDADDISDVDDAIVAINAKYTP